VHVSFDNGQGQMIDYDLLDHTKYVFQWSNGALDLYLDGTY
jgi:hypothetical protein